MSPKYYAIQCTVSGEENPQNCPFPWDFVTFPGQDRATAIGNMHKNFVKIARMAPEICSRIDRQTDRHRQTCHTHTHTRTHTHTHTHRRAHDNSSASLPRAK